MIIFDFLGLCDNSIAMQCFAYIISFLADQPCSGCHFPVSGEIDGLTGRFRGMLAVTLGAGRVETESIVPLRGVIELMLSIEATSLRRCLASFLSRLNVSRASISGVTCSEFSKRR